MNIIGVKYIYQMEYQEYCEKTIIMVRIILIILLSFSTIEYIES